MMILNIYCHVKFLDCDLFHLLHFFGHKQIQSSFRGAAIAFCSCFLQYDVHVYYVQRVFAATGHQET